MCPRPRYTDPRVVLSNISSYSGLQPLPNVLCVHLGTEWGTHGHAEALQPLIFPKVLEPTCISKKGIYRGLHRATLFFSQKSLQCLQSHLHLGSHFTAVLRETRKSRWENTKYIIDEQWIWGNGRGEWEEEMGGCTVWEENKGGE